MDFASRLTTVVTVLSAGQPDCALRQTIELGGVAAAIGSHCSHPWRGYLHLRRRRGITGHRGSL